MACRLADGTVRRPGEKPFAAGASPLQANFSEAPSPRRPRRFAFGAAQKQLIEATSGLRVPGGDEEWVDTVYQRREAAASVSATGRSRATATPLRRRGAFGSNTERRARPPPIRVATGEEVFTSFYTSCSEELVAEFNGESGAGLGDI